MYYEELWIRMLASLLGFTNKKADQSHEIKVKIAKMVPSKFVSKSKKPVLYFNNCSAAQRHVIW